ncbi:MAG: hypothetical protein KGM15_07030 [Pseudomonadota bacterium]|nr:hypothetical protein [Pseudomonadota bacterium]
MSRQCSSIRATGGCVSEDAALPQTPHATPQGDCRLASRPAGHVLQILAPPDLTAAALASALTDVAAHAIRSAGPGVWYLPGDASLTREEIARREARLGPEVRIVDQTLGRARLELSGLGATRQLATGTGVDISMASVPIGAVCEALFGHIGLHLTRAGTDRFELLVARSYALNFWEELTS